MAKEELMAIGTLFQFKDNIYQIMDNGEGDTCFGCYGFGKETLCKQLPHCCKGTYQVKFRKLNVYEIRQAIKNNKEIVKL